MIKGLEKVGNRSAIILNKALLELVGSQENDEVRINVHNGSIIITPIHPRPIDAKRIETCLDRLLEERRDALRRLDR